MNKSKLSIALAALIVSSASVMAAPPAVHNDFWQQADPINPIPASETQDTTLATVGVNANNGKGEPGISCASVGHTVWYKFTASKGGTVDIDTFGSDYDTVVGVYTRSGGDNFTQVACDDDSGGVAGPSVIADLDVTKGTTYYIQIGSFGSSAGGNLVLNVN